MSIVDKIYASSGLVTPQESARLAATITRLSSTQTYYTIRLLADRKLADDAYRAYAYFRWVDDIVDSNTGTKTEKNAFLTRQQTLLDACYLGQASETACQEERMLVDLVSNDHGTNNGLQSYLHNMMAVMSFDIERRGRTITQFELNTYSEKLATAVTDGLHYFIGHTCPAPCSQSRYLAVRGAHTIHMLRDLVEDFAAGYFNVPEEFLKASGLSIKEFDSTAFRAWVKNRIQQARSDFDLGRTYIRQVKNLRCRIAGFAYTARFEWMLRAIERDGYRLRKEYPERKSLAAGIWMAWATLSAAVSFSLAEKNMDNNQLDQEYR